MLDRFAEMEGVGEERQATLYSCALTSRSALIRSQMHLYSTVYLSRRQAFSSFGRTLRSRADLGALVRRLWASLQAWGSVDNMKAPPLKASAVAQMTNLREFDMAGVFSLSSDEESPPSPHIYSFLLSLACSCRQMTKVTLRILSFEEYADIVKLAGKFVCLEELSLRGVSVTSLGRLPARPAQTGSQKSLKALTVSSIRLNLTVRALTDARRQLRHGDSYWASRWDLTLPCWSASLQNLSLEVPHEQTREDYYTGMSSSAPALTASPLTSSFPTGLSCFPQLISLHLTFTDEDIRLVAAALRYVRSTAIRQLTFVHMCESQSRDSALDELGKLQLDDLLAVAPYLDLTSVVWRTVVRPGREHDAADPLWKNGIRERLKGCESRGILRCSIVRL